MTVIDFASAKAEREPHWSGHCKCVGCGHEWVGVGPIGTMWVDCPSCELPKGTPKYPFGPSEGDAVLVCNHCNGDIMSLYVRNGRTRVMCVGCGTDQTEAAFT